MEKKSKKQQIIEAYGQMKLVHPSLDEIADKVGVYKSYVWRVLKDYKNRSNGQI